MEDNRFILPVDNTLEALPTTVLKRVYGLKGVQTQHTELEKKFQAEIHELEKKYNALYAPLYEKRLQIISGSTEPDASDIEVGKKAVAADQLLPTKDPLTEGDDISGIPEFWLVALKNNQIIEGGITEKDAEALKFLTDIKVDYIEATKFQLNFHFSENPFFTNSILSKTFIYQESPISGAHIPSQAEGTTIEWKEGQNLTVEVKSKKQRHKETNKTRVVKKTVPADTFFNFFATRKISEEEEEGDEDVYDFLELDFEIGEEIKDKIVPHAIDWFTGKASELEGLGYDDDDEFGYEGDEYAYQSTDDDDEDDEEDEEATLKTQREQAPECKQQ